ncbi:hypothetical protein H9L39_06695 [Fusarium oxysporum f. sp. albedinis]|nr:hypothetical protein H9L39_06695 [Fusarium oxysporum f. sp. albedinis]
MSANSEAENWADISTPHTSRVHTNVRYHPDSWHGPPISNDDTHIRPLAAVVSNTYIFPPQPSSDNLPVTAWFQF